MFVIVGLQVNGNNNDSDQNQNCVCIIRRNAYKNVITIKRYF